MPVPHKRIAGLYAITPEIDDTGTLLSLVRAAIEGGARIVQYRNKQSNGARRLEHALGLSALCGHLGATFIINDDVALALEVDADGVHLGKTDGDLAAARKQLGASKLLGASCYNQIELARSAAAQGADHVAFGSMYVSSTKPGAVRAELALFAQARALGMPMVAIGGITLDNAAAVVAAGADAIAVISDLFSAPDVRVRAQQLSSLFPIRAP